MSAFLPATAEAAVGALLGTKISGVDTASISGRDLDEEGNLVLKLPCTRTHYAGTQYAPGADNQALLYNCEHMVEVLCAVENLRSSEAQREGTKALAGRVLEELAGARLDLADGSKSEPCRVIDVKGVPDDIIGTAYLVTVAVPGIAQFDGRNANPNS